MSHCTSPAPDTPDVAAVRAAVEHNFPDLWPAVDLGLATAATLLLADNVDPVAVIYVGGPSSSKTTVADFFDGHALCYRSDNFTPAAFVSHAASVSHKDLEKVDLLPRIKHKLLVTPELAPIFRGKEAELAQRFAILTRVLDGDGLMTDSGTHGQRGYRGDYVFAWLGCTTPFDAIVWRVMAQLGSRLFFLLMDSDREISIEDLVGSEGAVPYRVRMGQVRVVLHAFLSSLFQMCGGFRGVTWDATADPYDVKTWIARLAMVLAAMRSEPVREGDPERGRFEYNPPKREQPRRANAVLLNLARGHALVHGRRQISEEDLPILARVVVSSMPSECGAVFVALVNQGGESLRTGQVQEILGVKHAETARKVMDDLDGRGVIELETNGMACLPKFASGNLGRGAPRQTFRGSSNGEPGEPVTNREVCASSTPSCQKSGGVLPTYHPKPRSAPMEERKGERQHTTPEK